MKELDFDELDQAVNSLMNKTPQSVSGQSNDGSQVVEINASQSLEAEVSNSEVNYSEPEPTSSPVVQPDNTNQPTSVTPSGRDSSVPSVAIRRGKAMDIIRPATRDSDRRPPILSRANSRQGVTVQPSENPGIDNQMTDMLSEQSSSQASAENNASNDQSIDSVAMPASDSTQSTADVQPSSENMSSEAEVAGQESLNSPFLADAKVEKRPLGRPNIPADFNRSPVSGGVRSGALKTSGASISEVDAQLPEQPLPAEFSKEILEVETTSVGVDRSATGTGNPGPVRTTVNNPAVSSSQFQPGQAPTNGDQPPTNSIYDTAAYHQPLSHPAKSKPSWLIIVAIVVVVLLGIASGVALYRLGII